MRAIEAMIAWTPSNCGDRSFRGTAGKVTVVPWPDYGDRSERYMKTVGACFGAFRALSDDQRLARLMLDFHAITVRDGISPAVAHAAFLEIDEYAEAIARELDGAREVEPWLVGITQDRADDLVVDLKQMPSPEAIVTDLLKSAALADNSWVVDLLKAALAIELNNEPPFRRNLWALKLAIDVEGLLAGPEAVEQRWQSIREAFANA